MPKKLLDDLFERLRIVDQKNNLNSTMSLIENGDNNYSQKTSAYSTTMQQNVINNSNSKKNENKNSNLYDENEIEEEEKTVELNAEQVLELFVSLFNNVQQQQQQTPRPSNRNANQEQNKNFNNDLSSKSSSLEKNYHASNNNNTLNTTNNANDRSNVLLIHKDSRDSATVYSIDEENAIASVDANRTNSNNNIEHRTNSNSNIENNSRDSCCSNNTVENAFRNNTIGSSTTQNTIENNVNELVYYTNATNNTAKITSSPSYNRNTVTSTSTTNSNLLNNSLRGLDSIDEAYPSSPLTSASITTSAMQVQQQQQEEKSSSSRGSFQKTLSPSVVDVHDIDDDDDDDDDDEVKTSIFHKNKNVQQENNNNNNNNNNNSSLTTQSSSIAYADSKNTKFDLKSNNINNATQTLANEKVLIENYLQQQSQHVFPLLLTNTIHSNTSSEVARSIMNIQTVAAASPKIASSKLADALEKLRQVLIFIIFFKNIT